MQEVTIEPSRGQYREIEQIVLRLYRAPTRLHKICASKPGRTVVSGQNAFDLSLWLERLASPKRDRAVGTLVEKVRAPSDNDNGLVVFLEQASAG